MVSGTSERFYRLWLLVTNASDVTKPTLNITAPTPGQKWSNSTFVVTGTANDNKQVAAAFFQFNSNIWATAITTNKWTNWNSSVLLLPGTNTVAAYAVDTNANYSTTSSVSLFYVVSAPLTVSINGNGTISPNYNGALLQIGSTYTMTATASTGFGFTGWTGSSTTNGATLKFVMASNLTFTANFSPIVSCTYALSATSTNVAAGTASGGFNVTAASGCAWTATSGSSWIHTSSAGTGSGTVSYTVDANTATNSRTGTITISGHTFTVTQAKPTTDIPSAPTGVSATAGNGQATISWTAVSGATSYNIYWSTSSGVTKSNGTKISGATSPYSHTGRTNGTAYYYIVTAVNSSGESVESAQVVTVVLKIVFVPVAPMTPAVVGVAYNNTVVASVSGGQSPYHYQLDTMMNGAPPMGMIIDLSGNLTGTPTVAGTYTFGVCAVDLVGAQSCKTTTLVVEASATPIVTFDSLVIAQRETRTYDGGMFTGIVTEERYRLTGTATANGPIHTYLYTYPGNSGTLVMNGWTGIDIANNHFRAPGDPASTTFTFDVYTLWVSVSTGTLPLTVSVEADFWDPTPYLWSKASKTISFP
jgi:uncharacterized repeat protein (TIGR02543 family)